MAGQLFPNATSHFRGDRAALVGILRSVKPDITQIYHAFNPYPWALAPAEVAELKRLLECVRRALCATVENYCQDSRLQQMLSLAPEVESLVRLAARQPYRPGAFRPDFLHERDGGIRISEINARFPLNGYLLSYALDAAMRRVPYRQRLPVGFEGIPWLADVPRALEETLGDCSRILILKGRERGYDIRIFMDFWGGCREGPPEQISDVWADADFVILELHQDELLGHLPRAALSRLVEDGRYFNDIRTILLGHDKRLLAVFTSELLRDYLTAEDVETLHQRVVPTYVVGLNKEALAMARQRREEWILKPNLFGKGEGIVMGRSVSPEAWQAALDAAHPHYVLQPYVEQRRFDILTDAGGEEQSVSMKVVGLLPAFNDRFLGPGIYRASQGDIVNVAGGGAILAPVVVSS